jgi:hypothetical protein
MRPPIVRLVLCILVLCSLARPEVASAQCSATCEPGPGGCDRCVDSGGDTGFACWIPPPACGCLMYLCYSAKTEAGQEEVQIALANLGLGAPALTRCSAEATPPLAPREETRQ